MYLDFGTLLELCQRSHIAKGKIWKPQQFELKPAVKLNASKHYKTTERIFINEM